MKIKVLLAAIAALSLTACTEPSSESSMANDATTAGASTGSAPAALPRSSSPAGAEVFFISPADDATLASPVTVEFGIQGMDVVKAGDNAPHSGHHHLIIDADLPDLSLPIPASEHYVHFGDGSTRTVLTLEPGRHTLQLLLGDYLHIPHNPPITSATITIMVE